MNKTIFSLVFALLFSTVCLAEDAEPKKKKRDAAGKNSPAAALLNQLKDAGLTDEQKTKIEALAKKSMEGMRAARKEAGITPELMKKRAEAAKALKESGKSPAEIAEAADKEAGLTEAQVVAFKKANAARSELLKAAVALLSDEQKANLPKRMLAATKGKGQAKEPGQAKAKGKKKTEADN